MKIIYIGHLNNKARACQRYKALCELGYQVLAHTSVPKSRGYYDKPNLIDRVLWKIGIPRDTTKVNTKILNSLSEFKADILWIDKGNTIYPRTLKKIKKIHPIVKIISFAEDDMYAKHNHTRFYKKGLKYYDWVFTTKSYNTEKFELPSFGAKNVIFIGNAFDRNVHKPIQLSEKDYKKYSADVSFIGSYEKERAGSLLFLAQNGVKVRVWGGGWENFQFTHSNLIIEGRSLFEEEYIKAICATKINLCFLRKINRDLQTARSVEIPACQSFMLAERTNEHLNLFEEGKEAAYFGSNAELLEKVNYYLKNEEKRIYIENNGYKRCIEDGYSHHDRLECMIGKVLEE
ncbi:spore maturation protein CgeB [Bacillus sp. BK006]|nr:spore maturation protein CgeB [Bacillus sp. BK006]